MNEYFEDNEAKLLAYRNEYSRNEEECGLCCQIALRNVNMNLCCHYVSIHKVLSSVGMCMCSYRAGLVVVTNQ